MRKVVVAVLMLFVACAPVPDLPDRAEAEFATALLNSIQPASIARNREYCGYIGRDRTGELAATRPAVGEAYTCRA
ncbi:MAG: DUF4329 domain-containing protein, partial [Pseudomonadota bacterium]